MCRPLMNHDYAEVLTLISNWPVRMRTPDPISAGAEGAVQFGQHRFRPDRRASEVKVSRRPAVLSSAARFPFFAFSNEVIRRRVETDEVDRDGLRIHRRHAGSSCVIFRAFVFLLRRGESRAGASFCLRCCDVDIIMETEANGFALFVPQKRKSKSIKSVGADGTSFVGGPKKWHH